MPRRLELDINGAALCDHYPVPVAVGHGHDTGRYGRDETLHGVWIPRDSHFNRVFQHQGQQPGGGLGAHDGALEACRQQVRDTPDMVDVHMADNQCLDMVDRKINFELPGAGALARGFRPLEQTAIHQQTRTTGQTQFVAGARHTVGCAVVGNIEESRHYASSPGPSST